MKEKVKDLVLVEKGECEGVVVGQPEKRFLYDNISLL